MYQFLSVLRCLLNFHLAFVCDVLIVLIIEFFCSFLIHIIDLLGYMGASKSDFFIACISSLFM